MIHKAISLTTGGAMLSVYLWSQLRPNDALFLFASTNLAVNLLLLGLSAATIWLSFKDRFKSSWTYALAILTAAACLLIGSAGLISSTLDYKTYGLLGPIDFIFLGEIGVLFSIFALSYRHQPLKLRRLSLPRLGLPFKRPAIVLPRLALHSIKELHFG